MRHLLLAVLSTASLLAVTSDASAQNRYDRSGGGYYGHRRGGGYHYSGPRGGYYGGYGGYGFYPYSGFGLSLNFGYPGYGGYPGYSRLYGGYSDPPGSYGYAPTYAYPQAGYAPTYAGAPVPSAYQPAANVARFIVRLPADAKLWIDDYQSTQTGAVRELSTPASLEPGRSYSYTVKAQWTQNGQPVTQERTVTFQVGQSVEVDFSQPAPAAAPATPPPPATTPPAP